MSYEEALRIAQDTRKGVPRGSARSSRRLSHPSAYDGALAGGQAAAADALPHYEPGMRSYDSALGKFAAPAHKRGSARFEVQLPPPPGSPSPARGRARPLDVSSPGGFESWLYGRNLDPDEESAPPTPNAPGRPYTQSPRRRAIESFKATVNQYLTDRDALHEEVARSRCQADPGFDDGIRAWAPEKLLSSGSAGVNFSLPDDAAGRRAALADAAARDLVAVQRQVVVEGRRCLSLVHEQPDKDRANHLKCLTRLHKEAADGMAALTSCLEPGSGVRDTIDYLYKELEAEFATLSHISGSQGMLAWLYDTLVTPLAPPAVPPLLRSFKKATERMAAAQAQLLAQVAAGAKHARAQQSPGGGSAKKKAKPGLKTYVTPAGRAYTHDFATGKSTWVKRPGRKDAEAVGSSPTHNHNVIQLNIVL
ncbi:hypothetical protein DIPPA_14750 [Diplonema papillatum]|nr:hypothetical protein DIPPA_14750 [Diplonema papillatum]